MPKQVVRRAQRGIATSNNNSTSSSSLREKLMSNLKLGRLKPTELLIPDQWLPKYYAHAVEDIRKKEKDNDYGDYSHSTIDFNWQDDYEIISKIGRGRYSEVFEALNLLTNERVVIKMLKPVKKEKVRREVMCLKAMEDCRYAIGLYDIVCDPSNVTPSLVF